MTAEDILDAIGNVDGACVEKARQGRRSHKAVWIAVGSIAACLVLLILPNIHNLIGYGSADLVGDEMAMAREDVLIYYVDGDEICRQRQYLPLSAEDIFYAWRDKNGLDEDVVFIQVKIDSNSKTQVDGDTVSHEIGDRFVYNLTISKTIENYYDSIDRELLLSSLEQTMTGYSDLEYDGYVLILE